MPTRRAFTIVFLMLAVPQASMALAQTTDKPSLTAREIRYDVQCPSPREVPCAIKKPALSGYRVLTEKITLDDQGSYWIADLSKARQQQGKNEPIRILTDNGVWHIIEVKYLPGPVVKTASKKPDNDGATKSKSPETAGPAKSTGKPKDDAKQKEGKQPATKAKSKLESCYERCRNTS